MAAIKPSVLNLLDQNVNLALQRGIASAPPPVWSKFASEIPSSNKSEVYPWLKAIPGMREWLGPRQMNNVSASGYELKNKKWEDTIALDADDVEDNNVAIYTPAIEQLGNEAVVHLDQYMAETLEAGRTTACWDGQFFFDTDHPQDADAPGGTTYSNYYATDGTDNSSHALAEATFAKLWAKFGEFRKENGQPLGLVPDTIIVPPALAITAFRVLNMGSIAPAAALGGGAANVQQENPLKGLVEIVVCPRLTSATAWYLGVCKRPIKPLLLQMRKRADKLVRKDQAADDNVFFENKLVYGIDGR